MFFGVTPFATQVQSHLIQMIRTGEIEIPLRSNRKPSKELWDLLCAMLTKNPLRRITLEDVARHPFWQISPPSENALAKSPLGSDSAQRTNSITSIATALEVDYKQNGLADLGDGDRSIVETSFKVLKRSVSMGDSALASAALLQDKKAVGKASVLQKEAVVKKVSTTQTTCPTEASGTKTYNLPMGEANFTLHAQACPVTINREVNDTSRASKTGTGTNNDDLLGASSRRDSKLSTTGDSAQTTPYESHESLHPPLSPVTTDDRMTKSEYVFRESDGSNRPESSRLRHSHLSSKCLALVSAQTRARIALIYPWGDESATLPLETRLAKAQNVYEWKDILASDELEEFGSPHENEKEGDVKRRRSPSCIPQPLGDYDKWMRNPPTTSIRLPGDITQLSPEDLELSSLDEVNIHADALLEVMSDLATSHSPKARPSDYLSYIAWFLAVTTLKHTKGDSKKPNFEANFNNSILRTKHYMNKAVALLKPNTTTGNVRMWICRIIGLLAYRAAFMIKYYGDDPNRQSLIHTLVYEVAPELPVLVTAVVDLLREPASKGVFPLKQAGITALGELLVCEMCIYGQVFSDPAHCGSLPLEGYDVPRAQWQSALLQVIRSLAPANSRSGSASQTRTAFGATQVRPLERGTSSASASASGSSFTVKMTEESVRLAAARALNETVIVVIGCKLARLTQRLDMRELDRSHPGVQLAVSLSASVSSFLECLLTPENVSRVWADGVLGGCGGGADGKASLPAIAAKHPTSQQVAHTSASALAGLIRLRPSLFMCGLIDRNGTAAFMQKFNPSTGSRESQTTTFMACLLSATTIGLLLPLSFRGKPLGSSSLRIGLKSGTPVACRRLLNNPRFMAAITRHFESPHVMLRAKAYLLTAAALDSSTACSDNLVAACEARLPSCLERDLRMTNQHYTPKTLLEEDSVLIDGDESSHEAASMQGSVSVAPELRYLGICVRHLSDLIIYSLVPNICKQIAIAIGAHPAPVARTASKAATKSAKPSAMMTSSTYQERSKRNVASAGAASRLHTGATSNVGASGVSLKTWLPAFSCLPVILASSASVRNSLLLPATDSAFECEGHFCLIEFISKILDHWASTVGTFSGIHQPGSLEHQLLGLLLALAEDMSRQLDVVEGRRADLIKCLLPALARLAVAPVSDSITRAICVKIILDMKNVWCGGGEDNDSVTSSNISLNLPRSPTSRAPGLTRSPLSSDRLNLNNSAVPASRTTAPGHTTSLRGGENKRPSSSSAASTRSSSSRVSSYRPNSFYGKSSSGVSSLRGYRFTPNPKSGVQGPSPEVLLAVVDIVNNLLIPYASRLLDPNEPAPSAYFLRLLLDCLHSPPPPSPAATTTTATTTTPLSPNRHQPCVNSRLLPPVYVAAWRTSGLCARFVHFLAACDAGSHRFSAHCLLALRLLSTLFSDYPHETGLLDLLIEPPIKQKHNIVSVAFAMVVAMGSSILRRGRRDSDVGSTNSPVPKVRSATPSSSRGRPVLLKISAETVGVPHLLAALDLLNVLLTIIADVVRYALLCRQQKQTPNQRPVPSSARSRTNGYGISAYLPKDAESVCAVAEQLLSTARPPNHLPGILASLLEASSPDSLDSEYTPENAEHDNGDVFTCAPQSPAEHLVASATASLASLASLYGGEYCRTALSAAGLRGFAVAIRRRRRRSRTRLLLRILRRLCESDTMCTRRMTSPAAKHLQSAIWRLRSAHDVDGAGDFDTQDAATVRLAGALLERLHSHRGALLL
uniref:Protein kinase domain-containing protein n=1 Tax=Mesocestoides corti TaxID=53468 RepID=A0A5K3F2H2_MESCO